VPSCLNRIITIWTCNRFFRRNLSLYSLIGVLFVTSLVMCTHNEFEEPKYFSQAPPLVYIRQIRVLLLSFSSRKFFPLYSDAWKYICHLCTMKLHFSSLLNSHDDLLGSIWSILKYFDSLLTSKCGDYGGEMA